MVLVIDGQFSRCSPHVVNIAVKIVLARKIPVHRLWLHHKTRITNLNSPNMRMLWHRTLLSVAPVKLLQTVMHMASDKATLKTNYNLWQREKVLGPQLLRDYDGHQQKL